MLCCALALIGTESRQPQAKLIRIV